MAILGIIVVLVILFVTFTPQPGQNLGTNQYVIHEPYDGVEKDFGTVSIMNQTYHVANLDKQITNSTQPTWLEYYSVNFTFPHGIEPLNTPGGQFIESYVKFPDDPVSYRIAAGISQQPGTLFYNGFTTVLSKHTNPQAGFTFHNGTIQLLINWPKIHSELIVNGLNGTYQVGKPIDFQIEARGFDNFDAGARPEISIKNSNGTTIWNNPQTIVLCCPAETISYDVKFELANLGEPLIINETGTYTVDVSYNDKTIEKRFSVLQASNTSDVIHVINTNFTVNYTITNGTVFDIQKDLKSVELIVSEKSVGKGIFVITIPRALVNATLGNNVDDMFFVLINGNEVDYKEIQKTSENRTLSISLGEGDNKIEIIGSVPL